MNLNTREPPFNTYQPKSLSLSLFFCFEFFGCLLIWWNYFWDNCQCVLVFIPHPTSNRRLLDERLIGWVADIPFIASFWFFEDSCIDFWVHAREQFPWAHFPFSLDFCTSFYHSFFHFYLILSTWLPLGQWKKPGSFSRGSQKPFGEFLGPLWTPRTTCTRGLGGWAPSKQLIQLFQMSWSWPVHWKHHRVSPHKSKKLFWSWWCFLWRPSCSFHWVSSWWSPFWQTLKQFWTPPSTFPFGHWPFSENSSFWVSNCPQMMRCTRDWIGSWPGTGDFFGVCKALRWWPSRSWMEKTGERESGIWWFLAHERSTCSCYGTGECHWGSWWPLWCFRDSLVVFRQLLCQNIRTKNESKTRGEATHGPFEKIERRLHQISKKCLFLQGIPLVLSWLTLISMLPSYRDASTGFSFEKTENQRETERPSVHSTIPSYQLQWLPLATSKSLQSHFSFSFGSSKTLPSILNQKGKDYEKLLYQKRKTCFDTGWFEGEMNNDEEEESKRKQIPSKFDGKLCGNITSTPPFSMKIGAKRLWVV